jgi:DNA polymerase-3 subunit epsilon
MVESFAAIDFETANECLSSVCSVGVVVVRNGIIEEKYYSLIQPEPNYYNYRNVMVHGINQEDTENERVFPYVWREIESIIEGLPLIAHNKRFDEGCLKSVFRTYCMDYPEYQFLCTLSASRKVFGKELPNHKLSTVSRHCGFYLQNHHNALSDAEACAAIALKLKKL